MNRRASQTSTVVALAVWCVIAALLLSILVRGIAGHGFNLGSWDWNWGWSNGKLITDTRDLPLDGISHINISNGSTDAHITASSDDKIHLTYRHYVPKDSTSESADNDITVSGGTLSITDSFRNSGFFMIGIHQTSSIELALPASYTGSLDIKTASGDIHLPDSLKLSEMTLSYASGDVSGGDLDIKNCRITGISGNVRLQGLSSPDFVLKQTSGDINVNRLSGAGSLSSVSGDLTFSLSSLSGALTVSSVSGDVHAGFGSGVNAQMQVNSLSGDISSGYPTTWTDKHHVSMTIGSQPYQTVSLQTTSGDINVAKS